MNDRERFLACMAYQPVDHTPFWSWGGWPETIERWKHEGYDPAQGDPAAATDQRFWFGHWFHPHPPFAHQVVSEDAEHVVYINHEGILMKELKRNPWSSMPQFLKFPVETRAEFRQFWRERMQPDLARRIGPDWKRQLQGWRAEPKPFIIISNRWGGLDKRALARGPAAIDAELAHLQPLIDEGGYIPHTDHSCPPDISFANYCYHLQRLAEVCRH